MKMKNFLQTMVLTVAVSASSATFAVTPETGAVARLEAIVANIKGAEVDRTVPADLALLLRITERFAETYAAEFAAYVADQQNPTNAELAGFVILKIKEYGQDVIRRKAEENQRVTEEAPITNAGATAAADLD
jgi:hypothetical protein